MKKRILSAIFAFAFLVTVGLGVNESMKSNTGLSDLALANVEALAQESGGDFVITCGRNCGACYYLVPGYYPTSYDCHFSGLMRDICC
ncbi:MAG TPA: hypothetical protein GX708_18055 [Gallicola sp.]|nr:hypothetical protein [Gallicola sp.]